MEMLTPVMSWKSPFCIDVCLLAGNNRQDNRKMEDERISNIVSLTDSVKVEHGFQVHKNIFVMIFILVHYKNLKFRKVSVPSKLI